MSSVSQVKNAFFEPSHFIAQYAVETVVEGQDKVAPSVEEIAFVVHCTLTQLKRESQPILMEITDVPLVEYYSITFDCAWDNREETVDKVASFVAKAYGLFPRLEQEERQQLRAKRVAVQIRAVLPPKAECDLFETNLKQRIVNTLNQKDSYYGPDITLDTTTTPVEVLREVCDLSFSDKYQMLNLFPYKAHAFIKFFNHDNSLRLSMSFKAPPL